MTSMSSASLCLKFALVILSVPWVGSGLQFGEHEHGEHHVKEDELQVNRVRVSKRFKEKGLSRSISPNASSADAYRADLLDPNNWEAAGSKVAFHFYRTAHSVTPTTEVSIAVAAFGTFATLVCYFMWRHIMPKEIAVDADEDKAFLDNIKACAICCVTTFHLFIRLHHEGDSQTWLADAGPVLNSATQVLSVFQMPAFCFISGVLSQGGPTARRVRNWLQLIFATILWHCVELCAGPILRFDGTYKSLGALHHFSTLKWQNKEWLWYLVALIVWRGLTLTIWAWLKAPVVLFSAFFLSCFEAYLAKSSGYEFLRGLHDGLVGPTFGFMPIFAFGYIFPFKEVSQMTRDRSVSLCVAVAALYCTIVWTFPYSPLLATGNFYFTNDLLGYHQETPFGQYCFWTRRVAITYTHLLATLVLIFYAIPRQRFCLTWLGQYTLYIYAVQYDLLEWRAHLIHRLPIPVCHTHLAHAIVLLLHVVLAIVIALVISSRPVRLLVTWALEPKWLDPIVYHMVQSDKKALSAYESQAKAQRELLASRPSGNRLAEQGH